MSPALRRFAPFAVIAALALGACADQIHRKDVAAQSARDVSGDIDATNNQIDATLASLNNLMSADPSQLQPAYNQYSKDVDQMRAQAAKINKDSGDMRKQSQDYLTNWQKQHNEIQNAELRTTSEQRRQTVMNRFQGIQGSYDNARTSLDDFISNLEDVRTALRNDLTAHGVQAVSQTSVVKDAQTHAANVKTALQQVQSNSTALADALNPPAPTATQGSSTGQSSTSNSSGQTSANPASGQTTSPSTSGQSSPPATSNTGSQPTNQ
jgi:chromosome segregation ATPase